MQEFRQYDQILPRLFKKPGEPAKRIASEAKDPAAENQPISQQISVYSIDIEQFPKQSARAAPSPVLQAFKLQAKA